MNWAENKIIDVTTSQVFYFDNTREVTVNRICDELKVDIFPSIDHKTYFSRINEKWEQLEIKEFQKIEYDTLAFDKSILERFHQSPSNLLFVFEQGCFKGLLHFTDYGKKVVYETLYHNFFEFEKSLKQYLISKEYGYDKFIEYLERKAEKVSSGSKNFGELQKKIERINKFRDTSPNLDLFTLLELLLFTIADIHEKPLVKFKKESILTNDQGKGSIDNLRNMVMHTRDTTGMTETLPHNFDRFRTFFFLPVMEFKEAFRTLLKQWAEENIERRERDNAKLLDYLYSLGSDQLHQKFFNYDKYI